MRDDRDGDFLDLIGRYEVESIKQRQRLGSLHQRQGRARAGAELHAGRAPGGTGQLHDVTLQFFTQAHLPHRRLEGEQVCGGDARVEIFQRMVVGLRRKNGHLVFRRHVAEGELQGEAVHLRLGQRVGAAELDRVLSSDDKKQVGQAPPLAIDAHLAFAHRLEQRRLGAG